MIKRTLQGALFGAVLLVLLATLGARAGYVSVPLTRPDTAAFWQTSRAAGFAAYAALALEVLFGLFLSTGAADRWIARARSVEAHRWLSSVTLALVVAHAAALLGDRFIRFDVLDVLVPFLAPYRPLAVGLGVLAAYAAIVVHASFALRARIGQRAWRALHFLSFAVFFGATTHGLLAGTDSGLTWVRGVYAGSAALVLWLTFYRAGAALSASLEAHLPQIRAKPIHVASQRARP